jgi:formylglycine-generating enzyme required for sulfatase activity
MLTIVFAASASRADNDLIIPDSILIPAGPFIMGSTDKEREMAYQLDERSYGHNRTREWGWYDNEIRSTPTLPTYGITKTPITNRQYKSFLLSTGYKSPAVGRQVWKGYGLIHPFSRMRRHVWVDTDYPTGRGGHPVVLVNKSDVDAYAKWLSSKTGQHWRLPSEQEWEKAARGVDGRWFPWGNNYDPSFLNNHDEGPFDTTSVGQFPKGASPFGLLDVAGLVFEWTSTSVDNNRFIVKGGSWDDKGCGVCRPAAHHSRPAQLKHILIGFRLVRVIPQ